MPRVLDDAPQWLCSVAQHWDLCAVIANTWHWAWDVRLMSSCSSVPHCIGSAFLCRLYKLCVFNWMLVSAVGAV